MILNLYEYTLTPNTGYTGILCWFWFYCILKKPLFYSFFLLKPLKCSYMYFFPSFTKFSTAAVHLCSERHRGLTWICMKYCSDDKSILDDFFHAYVKNSSNPRWVRLNVLNKAKPTIIQPFFRSDDFLFNV